MASVGRHKRVWEYDGAFKCLNCKAMWGALPDNPEMPEDCLTTKPAPSLLSSVEPARLSKCCGAPVIETDDIICSKCHHPCLVAEVEREEQEWLAEKFHAAYERLAPKFGYETRRASAVPWAEVSPIMKALMMAVAGEILQELAARDSRRDGEK